MQQPNDNLFMKELARRWQEGTITEEEKKLFNQWYHSFDDIHIEDITTESLEHLKTRLYTNIIQKEQILPGRSWFRNNVTYLSSAAVLALIFSISGYFYNRSNSLRPRNQTALQERNIIRPGSNKAVLMLADGSAIVLDQKTNAVLKQQGNVSVTKSKAGQLSYHIAKNTGIAAKITAYNLVSTPRGGQYQVNLSDGTKVWLNAASTLRFPAAFNNDTRVVELTGEAYFEVNPARLGRNGSKRIPFLVKTRNQLVEVLGTHFNVNAYADEPDTKTTLLKGAVKVVQLTSKSAALLKPGQQSVVAEKITVSAVDALQSIAWQKGDFVFDNETVESMMRKISRWYDVDVEYRGNIRFRKFGGRISKFENIAQILHLMEKTQVIHFNIQGRRVIVMP